MRFGKVLLVGGVIMACAVAALNPAEAQLRRRSPALRSQPAKREAVTRSSEAASLENRELVTGKVVQLSPMLIPAVGPSGAQGIASVFYNDVDTSLNSGNLVVTGLPAGHYYAWLVFFDPFTPQRSKTYSELVAKFIVPENGARVETALTIGLPNVVNISHAQQIIVTNAFKTDAEVGRLPVSGAAGYSGGPGRGQAVLAANIN